MISTLLLFTATSFSVGAAGLRWVDRRSSPERRRERRVKLAGYFAVVHAVLFCAWLGRAALGTLFLGVAAVGGAELVRAHGCGDRRVAMRSLAATLGCYGALAAGLVAFALTSAPASTVYVYLIVAAFDGFSQVAGESLGRRRLAPRVSPNKTIEGALGGLFAAVSTAVALRSLPQLDWSAATSVGALTAAAALGGDLAASWVKRRNGIKDFGTLLPGQGGVLDRFDSLLLAGSAAQMLSRTILP